MEINIFCILGSLKYLSEVRVGSREGRGHCSVFVMILSCFLYEGDAMCQTESLIEIKYF